MRCCRSAIFRIAATCRQRAHRVANLPLRHVVRFGDHFACHFKAHHGRGTRRGRVVTRALQAVRAIHARVGDFNQHFTRFECGQRAVVKLHHVRCAAGAVIDKFHGSWECHGLTGEENLEIGSVAANDVALPTAAHAFDHAVGLGRFRNYA